LNQAFFLVEQASCLLPKKAAQPGIFSGGTGILPVAQKILKTVPNFQANTL
jgi:hypothetical protein